MRAFGATWVLLSVAAVACGGRVDHASSVETGDAGVVAPACAHPPTLALTSSTVVVPAPEVPITPATPNGPKFSGLYAIAATPSGDQFIITWIAEGIGPTGGMAGAAVVVQPGTAGGSVMPPVAAPLFAQAAFDGSEFAVVGNSNPPVNGVPPLVLQRVALSGSAIAPTAPVTIVGGFASASTALTTPRGVAIGWMSTSEATGDKALNVALLDADGGIEEQAELPFTAPYANPPIGLAIVQGQLLAAAGSTITGLPWLGGASTSTQLPVQIVSSGIGGGDHLGNLELFASGDHLTFWGMPADDFAPGSHPASMVTLFSGAPAGPFAALGNVDPTVLTQQPDGCGGLVTLSRTGATLSVSGGAAATTLALGTDPYLDTWFSVGMTAAGSGYGVTWVDTDGIHLATMAWE